MDVVKIAKLSSKQLRFVATQTESDGLECFEFKYSQAHTYDLYEPLLPIIHDGFVLHGARISPFHPTAPPF